MEKGPVPPYGTAIYQAIAKGDLAQMKKLVREAEQFLAEHGDVRSAIEVLKSEIQKLEFKKS
jgi:hypothetical protein